jgi:hypothetical protein
MAPRSMRSETHRTTRTATLTTERKTEMFHKMPAVLPIAILLGAVSAAPALAQTGSHQGVQRPRHVMVLPFLCRGNACGSHAMRPGQSKRQQLGETPDLPWIQDPHSPGG